MTNDSVRKIRRIPNTNIVIDDWKRSQEDLLHFMSVIPINEVEKKLLKESDYKIYSRKETAWYLHEYQQVDINRFVILETNIPTKISENEDEITVTAFDANYNIGSSMFLFEGSFGNILFTGYFRPSIETSIFEVSVIKNLIAEKALHTVYVDNTYASEDCKFPSRKDVINETISLIRENPEHRIILSKVTHGKEEIILAVAKALKVKIFVSEERFEFYRSIKAEEYVTTNPEMKKYTLFDGVLRPYEFKTLQSVEGMCTAFVFTALYSSQKSKAPKINVPHYHIMPYSSHCSHLELMEFLSQLKPQEIKPILINEEYWNFRIPQCMFDLCYVPTDSQFPLNSDFQCSNNSAADDTRVGIKNDDIPLLNPEIQIELSADLNVCEKENLCQEYSTESPARVPNFQAQIEENESAEDEIFNSVENSCLPQNDQIQLENSCQEDVATKYYSTESPARVSNFHAQIEENQSAEDELCSSVENSCLPQNDPIQLENSCQEDDDTNYYSTESPARVSNFHAQIEENQSSEDELCSSVENSCHSQNDQIQLENSCQEDVDTNYYSTESPARVSNFHAQIEENQSAEDELCSSVENSCHSQNDQIQLENPCQEVFDTNLENSNVNLQDDGGKHVAENVDEPVSKRSRIDFELHKMLYSLRMKVGENKDLRRDIWYYMDKKEANSTL